MSRAGILCFLAILLVAGMARAAVDPAEYMADPALQAKAETLYGEIRCVVCQSESIGDSNADVAKDMRAMIRARLEAGDDEKTIVAFLHDRYGDSVLMKPPVRPATWPLWAGPFIILLGGALAASSLFRRRAA
jgi:cytochrome c-type biogenesis protein CcmH